ncbi:MAG TPA: class I SAM-dependent methyltransferase [Isosphaeraceae bacterium]|nr:class I SAM-dependent methyltransferase [Isosphaeraceae bacterium]
MKQYLKSVARMLPYIRRLIDERDALRAERDALAAGYGEFPGGHYYSPIPAPDEIRRRAGRLFDRSRKDVPSIDLNVEGQLETLRRIEEFYGDCPFPDGPSGDFRYYFDNQFFSYSDAIFTYGMIRLASPSRIVEVGSGYPSCVMLDTNERSFGGRIRLIFIEPDPARLRSRLRLDDVNAVEIHERMVQDVDLAVFEALGPGDILFIDSSHVTKVGSDVNHMVFEVLPRLSPGVYVHFHDMFYPFEYPEDWILGQRRYWNEDYLLRAFLQFNGSYAIAVWDHFLWLRFGDRIAASMPRCARNPGGSLWLVRSG